MSKKLLIFVILASMFIVWLFIGGIFPNESSTQPLTITGKPVTITGKLGIGSDMFSLQHGVSYIEYNGVKYYLFDSSGENPYGKVPFFGEQGHTYKATGYLSTKSFQDVLNERTIQVRIIRCISVVKVK